MGPHQGATRLTGALVLAGVAMWFATGPLMWLAGDAVGLHVEVGRGFARLVLDAALAVASGYLAWKLWPADRA